MREMMFERYAGQAAAGQLDAFLPAYEEVYAEPPYREGPHDVAEFITRFRTQTRRPGMRLVLARDGEEVVGFAFGYLLPPDTGWWENLLEPLPAEFAQETGERTFVVIELAVRKRWRRRGIAAALHRMLLDGLRVERVTLTMRPEPEAAPAQSAYTAWGYRKVGVSHPWEDAPYYDAMVLDISRSAGERYPGQSLLRAVGMRAADSAGFRQATGVGTHNCSRSVRKGGDCIRDLPASETGEHHDDDRRDRAHGPHRPQC